MYFLYRLKICLLAFIFCTPNLALASFFTQGDRVQIRIVGSSTVYPFVATIAESFGRETQYRTPIVEATGTGGGFKLFCSGVGSNYPDVSNASRKIKKSEIERCSSNNISNPLEVKIGYDGIVLANTSSSQKFNISTNHIFLALADKIPDQSNSELVDNYYKKWIEIDPKLPDVEIAVYGPPPTSGTRDAFVELVMEKACDNFKLFKQKYPDSKKRHKLCQIIRSDGKFIEAGENDNLIVQKLKSNPDALGIFGFSFLQENKDLIQASVVDNIEPSFDSIISGNYKISRSLYMYFKKESIDLIPGMREFIDEVVSSNTIGIDGYLLQKGLIPLSDLETKQIRSNMAKFLKF